MAVYAMRCNKALVSSKPLKRHVKKNQHRKNVEAFVDNYDISFRKDPTTGEMIAIPIERKPTLHALFLDYNGNYIPVEIDWGDPVGNEVW